MTTREINKRWAPYRSADYLRTPAEAEDYLKVAVEDGEPAVFLLALRDVAESAGGMTWLARQSGLCRESLYRVLSEAGNPRLSSLDAILRALGLRLSIRAG